MAQRHSDIVLYSGNQMVVFYGSNSWSYTRLGHISKDEIRFELGTKVSSCTRHVQLS